MFGLDDQDVGASGDHIRRVLDAHTNIQHGALSMHGCVRLLTPSLCTGHVAVRQVPHSRVAAAHQAVCGHFVGVPVAFHCPLGDRSNHLLLQQSQLQSILDPFPLNCNNCVSIRIAGRSVGRTEASR